MKKFLFILFLICINPGLYGQSCQLLAGSTKVCLGSSVPFTANVSGATALSYTWNFGNSVTSTQGAPSYIYPTAGNYTPTVKIKFTNGNSCTATGPLIRVFDKPIANFDITTPRTQCYPGNNFCILDLSAAGSSNAPIKGRLILWGDGYFDTNPLGNTRCHNYTNPAGAKFTIVIEVTDTNNCVSRLEKQDSITLLPAPDPISFITNFSVKCNTTPVTFINTSVLPKSKVKHFRWIFGDGQIDSTETQWNTFIHNYTMGGTFNPQLIVENIDGCRDTFTLAGGAANAKFGDKIDITVQSRCFKGQDYVFSFAAPGQATCIWKCYSPAGKLIDSKVVPGGTPYMLPDKSLNCGLYRINMFASYANCSKVIDTFVDVYGPNAVIQNDTVPIPYTHQCAAKDTVRFRTPVPDISCYHKNNMFTLWDFGDPFAPPCTTDTRNGKFVNVNCNYSKDSINVWHYYTPNKDTCYVAKLLMADTARGCFDRDSIQLVFKPPSAHPNLPLRKGLYHTGSPSVAACKGGVPVEFLFDELLPDCGFDTVFIMPDSACNSPWLMVSKHNLNLKFMKYTYPDPCDTANGWVTVGLIVKNGNCWDTAWYHKMFHILPINPRFTAKVNSICHPYPVEITMQDSIQDSLYYVIWSYTELTTGITTTAGTRIYKAKNDSIIPKRKITINKDGLYQLTVSIRDTHNCISSFDTIIALGYFKDFDTSKTYMCLGDTVSFNARIRYFDFSTGQWADSTRALAGKEKIWWDLDDGKGFRQGKIHIEFKPDSAKDYRIRMATKDSLSCYDTVENTISVTTVDAQMKSMRTFYACAPQSIQFTDSSSSYSNGSPNPSFDFINGWLWTYSDKKLSSFLQNPVHDFTSNDTFKVKLFVTTDLGCTDSTDKDIIIFGPRPRYLHIAGDTIGCSPVEVTLQNTTNQQLNNWIWDANGPVSLVLSTVKDTNVTFKLIKAGVYQILLTGESNIIDPVSGSPKFCTQIFPDPLNPNLRPLTITVYDKPTATLTAPDSVCPYEVFNLKVVGDTVYKYYKWNFGDNDSLQTQRIDSIVQHSYALAGNYLVQVIPITTVALKCIDTMYKPIVVRDVLADFDIDESESPSIKLKNKSVNAVRYLWAFGQPLTGAIDTSTQYEPKHTYDDLTDSVLVCLIAYNSSDCPDTACKKTFPITRSIRLPNVFTPNGDLFNDAFDVLIEGENKYEIIIYNRWGVKVFESSRDGDKNDGINWNGKMDNTGSECPPGTFYYVFKYQFIGIKKDEEVHGTITLIR